MIAHLSRSKSFHAQTLPLILGSAATSKRKAPSSQLKDEPKTKLPKPENTVST